MKTSAIHVLVFISGAVGLVYELVWMRWCASSLGATAPAAAATLSAVFLGLALGGALCARHARHLARPLAAYGLLEAALALAAAASGPALTLVTARGSLAVRTLAAIAVLAVPATLMGATLPVLANALAAGRLGVAAGGLYAANTAGAVVGALALPYALLALLGVDGSFALAIAAGLAVAVAARWLDPGPVETTADPAPSAATPTAVLAIAFVSGFAQIGLEVLWTRMFAQVHESSVHAFAIVVAVYLAGIAAGAALARAALKRGAAARPALAASWLAAGLFVMATPRLFWWLTAAHYTGANAHGELLVRALQLVGPPALAGGAGLVFVYELAGAAAPDHRAAVLGRVSAANALGCALGPLLVTFGALPGPGLWWTVVALGALLAFTAGASLAASLPDPAPRAASLAFALAALAAYPSGGVPRVRLATGEHLLGVYEGAHALVAAIENDRERFLRVDNSYTLGGTGGAGDERQQALLPLALHAGASQDVAFLGLGTGVTAAAALYHPVRSVTAVEIAPEIVRAALEHFGVANRQLVLDRRATVLADDARAYLRNTDRRFDVIVGDLVVPWRPGESALFTAEHFESCRNHLKPGGLMCQWLPLFQLSEENFRTIAATFRASFPRTLLVRGDFYQDQPALALVGLASDLDPAAVDRRMSHIAPAVSDARTNPYMVDPAGPWLYVVGPLEPADTAGAPLHTDAHPLLELSSHRASPFTGRPLFEYLRKIAARPYPRPELRAAGLAFAEAALLGSEGHDAAAQEKADAALAAVPAPLRQALTR